MSSWIFRNKAAWLALWLVFGIGLDQATKIWAEGRLAKLQTRTIEEEVEDPSGARDADGKPVMVTQKVKIERYEADQDVVVVDGWWNFHYARNEAAAFSLTSSIPKPVRRPFLLTVSFCACIAITIWYLRMKQADGIILTSFALIISGALGNFADRARLGYVIDFIDWYVSAPQSLVAWLNAPHEFWKWRMRLGTHWPTFNIADTLIVVGAFGVIFRTFKPFPEEKAAIDNSAALAAGGKS